MPTFFFDGRDITIDTLYSYGRVSTDQQTIEKGGEGLPRQEEMYLEFAAQYNLPTSDLNGSQLHFSDAGKSGSKAEHLKNGAGLAGFMGLAKTKPSKLGPHPGLAVESFSRLGRMIPAKFNPLFWDLMNSEVTLVTLKDRRAYNLESTTRDKGQVYQIQAMMQAASSYAEDLAYYGRKSWAARRGTVTALHPAWFDKYITLGGGTPVQVQGFKGAPTGALLELRLDPTKHALWQRIITEIQGIGLDRYCRLLNREGVKSFTGGVWDPAGLAAMIRGRMILGEQQVCKYIETKHRVTGETVIKRTFTGTIIKDAYAPVVTEDQWLLANAALDGRKKGVATGRNVTKWGNLFGPLAVCDACGGRMKIKQRGRVGQFHYMACSNAGIGKCSVKRYFRLDRVETNLFTWIQDPLKDWSKPVTEDRSVTIKAEIAKAKTEAAAIEAAYERSMLRSGEMAEKLQTKLEADHAAKLTEVKLLERELARVLSAMPADELIDSVKALLPGLGGLKGPDLISARGHIAQALPTLLPGGLRFRADGAVLVMRDGYVMEIDEKGELNTIEDDQDDHLSAEDYAA